MAEILIPIATSIWLGILTSISPCPLATNIAAISYLSKRINHPALVLVSGLAYTFGRMLAYSVLGFLIVTSITSVPSAAQFLQKYMSKALGPVLIITGLVLLGVIRFNFSGLAVSEEKRKEIADSGVAGSFLLGIIFALAFCPVSAAIFFGSLIPLALDSKFGPTLPFIYGIGTGLPVIIFALAIALGVKSLSRWFTRLSKLESFMRVATGVVFILVGAYYIFQYFIPC